MSKCKHEHVCTECVHEEIKELENKLAELRRKLPETIVIKEYIQIPQVIKVPYYPQPAFPFPQQPWITCGSYSAVSTNDSALTTII